MQSAHREGRFLLATLLGVLALAAYIALPYLNTLTLAIVIGIIFKPVSEWINQKIKSEGIAAGITLLLVLALVITPLAFFAFQAGEEAVGLYTRVTRDHTIGELSTASLSINHIAEKLPAELRVLVPDQIDVGPILRSVSSWVVERVGSLFGIVTGLALDLFLLIVGTYYVMKDGKRFVAYLIKIAPIEHDYEGQLFNKLHASVISVVRGSIAIAIIQGVAAGVGFFALGVPNPALWGAATIIASLIPIVGTAMTLVPAVIYLVATGAIGSALLLAGWGILIVGFVDNAFRGQFMKKGLDVHPFLILLSVLGGLEFFGPIGFISGPLLLSILMGLLDIYTSYRDKADSIDGTATLST